jgi:endonuclease YncB( thermonuclease family)
MGNCITGPPSTDSVTDSLPPPPPTKKLRPNRALPARDPAIKLSASYDHAPASYVSHVAPASSDAAPASSDPAPASGDAAPAYRDAAAAYSDAAAEYSDAAPTSRIPHAIPASRVPARSIPAPRISQVAPVRCLQIAVSPTSQGAHIPSSAAYIFDSAPDESPRIASGGDCWDTELKEAIFVSGGDFSFRGLRVHAKVVQVYDGDTVRIAFRYCHSMVQLSARMRGYDSPELKPRSNVIDRDEQKAAAIVARNALATRVRGKVLTAALGNFDKYGRALVVLYDTLRAEALTANYQPDDATTDINQWMIALGHGVPYDGGTKATGP